jgi:hypothetical protein
MAKVSAGDLIPTACQFLLRTNTVFRLNFSDIFRKLFILKLEKPVQGFSLTPAL